MTVRIQKPAVNIREKLAELERPIGINGQALLATDTPQQAFDLLGSRNRNLVINGDMRIDQRYAGASDTGINAYLVDRWMREFGSVPGSYTFQRVTDAPVGFTNSLKVTVNTASGALSVSASLAQKIEGYNIVQLNWGTANAQPVTLSFWVKSSITGYFGGAINNNYSGQTYNFGYNIISANTWEYKTVTIPGSTSSTWVTDNTLGLNLVFGLGAAAARQAAANAWANNIARQPTGSVDLVTYTGATFQITGVQLEVGKVATPFEYRSYGQELALCQRYYQEMNMGDAETIASGPSISSNRYRFLLPTPVTMRSLPTVATTGSLTFRTGGADYAIANMSSLTLNSNGIIVGGTATSVGNALSGSMYSSGGTSKITLSIEL